MAPPQQFQSLPLPLRRHIAAVVLLGGLSLLPVLRGQAWSVSEICLLVGLLLLAAAFGAARVRLALETQWISLDIVAIGLAQVTLDVRAAVLCAMAGALTTTYVSREAGAGGRRDGVPLHRGLFNVGACAFSAAGAGLAYEWLAGRRGAPTSQALILGLAAWAAVCFLLNTGAIARAIALSSGRAPVELWRRHCLWTAPGYFAAASVAAGVALLFRSVGLWALLPLPVIYVIYEALREHAERLRLQEAHIGELNRITESVMASLGMAIEAKDRYTREHIRRVQLYGVSLAEAAGVAEEELEAVRLAALVHDVGKIAIPERILSKPTKLSPDEFSRMKTHVTIGAMILDPVRFPYPVVEAVRSHHERWDGLGYPGGLRGEEIPVGGRIIAIADFFDALTRDRPYRKAVPLEEGLALLRQGAGSQFDPGLVESFCKIHPEIARRLEAMTLESRAATDDAERLAFPDAVFSEIAAAATEDEAADFHLEELGVDPGAESFLAAALDRIQSLLPAMTAVAYEIDAQAGELVATTVAGAYVRNIQGMTIRLGEGVSGRAALDCRPFLNASALLDVGRVFDPGEHIELSAALCVPIAAHGETLAVIALYHTSYEIYNEHHLRVLTTVSQRLAEAVELRRRSARGRAVEMIDPRTGLHNSRYLSEFLDQKVVAVRREEGRLALLLLIISDLTSIVERFGHHAAEEALAAVARQLRRCAGEAAVVCRYAAGEFVIVVEGAGPEEAGRFADRVRETVGELVFWDSIRLPFTLGAAVFPDDARDARSLLAAARSRHARPTGQLRLESLAHPTLPPLRWDLPE